MSERPGFPPMVDASPQRRALSGPGFLLWALFAFLAAVPPLLVAYEIDSQFHIPVIDFVIDPQTGIIQEVAIGSSADISGFWPGDVILAVDGAPFSHSLEWPVGVSMLAIRRGEEHLTLELPIFPLVHYNAPALISAVLVAVVFWGSSILLLIRQRRLAITRLLYLIGQLAAMTVFYPLAHPPPWERIPGPLILSLFSFYWLAPLTLHLYLSFPIRLGTIRQRRWGMGGVYGLSFFAMLTSLSGRPDLRRIGEVYTVLLLAAAMTSLVYAYFSRAAPEDRRRMRLIFFSTLLAIIPASVFFFVPGMLGLATSMPVWLAGLFLLAIPISYFHAITRNSLFGIDRLLNRAVVYGVLSLAILLLYLGPFLIIYRFAPGDFLAQMMAAAGLTLLVGISFDWTRGRVQRWVDRLFYGGWYDYPGVVETVSNALARCLERGQLEEVLTRQVPALMQLNPGRLGFGDQGATIPLGEEIPFMQFPLEFQGARRALWVVGIHQDGDDFSASDQRILQTLARQAETALGNVLLVEALRRQLDEIRASRAALTQAQRQLLRSREDERARLARDLHDGPLQVLVGLNMQLGLLQMVSGAPGDALGEMRGEVQTLLAELRQVCVELRPPMLDLLGLGAALRALAEEWSAQSGLMLRLDLPTDAELRSLPGEAAVNLYRVAQEALANIARHAQASRATLTLARQADGVRLSVQDDGCGFSLPAAHELTASGHFGLVGMCERAAAIGGELVIEAAPGMGTCIQVIWRTTGDGRRTTEDG